MSDQTKQALNDAIAAHFADEHDDAIISQYVIQMADGSLEDYDQQRTAYLRETADGQPLHASIGLTHFMAVKFEELLYTEDDDD